MTAACVAEDPLDEPRLRVAIRLDVVPEPSREATLQLGISVAVLGVSPQPVAERQVTRQLVAVSRANVEVVTRHVARGLGRLARRHPPEGLAPGHAAIPEVLVPDRAKPPHDLGQHCPVGDDDVDVEDRLGSQAPDGGAADVLDRDRGLGERSRELLTQLLEPRRPARIGIHDLDEPLHGADDSVASRHRRVRACIVAS